MYLAPVKPSSPLESRSILLLDAWHPELGHKNIVCGSTSNNTQALLVIFHKNSNNIRWYYTYKSFNENGDT